MINNKKAYILVFSLLIACSATYSSYSYFTSQSIETSNKISIAKLDSEELVQEIVQATIIDRVLELKFSKRLFFYGNSLLECIGGDNELLENTEITMDKDTLYIKKIIGEWNIPSEKSENDLPRILIKNFEDRFGNIIKPQYIYFYKNKDYELSGEIDYIIANKDDVSDIDISVNSISGINHMKGNSSKAKLTFYNSKEDFVDIIFTAESKAGAEELVNNKKIRFIPCQGTEAYSEWNGDTLEVYLCYDNEYSEDDIQSIIDNVVNIDILKFKMHEYDISKINVKFNNNQQSLNINSESKECEGLFGSGINTIIGKNTRGSIFIKGYSTITGRLKIKISDEDGILVDETILALNGEGPEGIINKIFLTVFNELNSSKYIITLKEEKTRIDITSRMIGNTGLVIEVEN